MGPLDAFIVYKFIRLLATSWDETDAFRKGVIDKNGKLLVPTAKQNDEQKKTYTLFHRLVFNIKRLIERIPGMKTKLGTYAACLYLFREQLGDEEGIIVFERSVMTYLKENDALEATYLAEQYLEEQLLSKGSYKTINNILDTKGETIQKGTVLVAKQNLKPIARVLGVDVYQLQVGTTSKQVVVSHEDISEV